MMLTRKLTHATAILPMAVLLLGLMVSGCATSRQVGEVKAEIVEAQAQNQQTQDMVGDIRAIVQQESEENRRLRADMTVTIDQLETQISQLQETYQDLIQRIDQLYAALESGSRLSPSPGARRDDTQTAPPRTGDTKPDIPPTLATPDPECNQMYDDGFILVRQTEYEQAIAKLRSFLEACPEHEAAERAYFWIGESQYSLEQYTDAVETFEYLLETYKESPNTSRALYKLGRSKEEMGKTGEAKEIFQRLIDNHPGTLEAEQAKDRLKML